MAQQVELEIQRRDVTGKAVRRLRRQGIIPANIFGHKEAPLAVQVDSVAFDRFRRGNKATALVTLRFPNERATQTVLVRRIQHEPVSDKILHIDFFRVSRQEEITVKVPLQFVGEAPGVKNAGGTLLHLVDSLEIACRAANIPEAIEVDITPLEEIGSMLHAGDVKLPSNVRLITDSAEPIAKIEAPRALVAEEAAEAAEAAATEEAAEAAPPAEEGSGA